MNIRIIKTSDPVYWYADKIGKVYEVARENVHTVGGPGGVSVRIGGFVDAGDFEIVNEEASDLGVIEQMQAEINELKSKVAVLEGAKISIREAGENTFRAVVKGKSLLPKTPQQIRNEIVAKAKADVAGRYKVSGRIPNKWSDDRDVEFIVNKEKRTVAVLLRGYLSGQVYEKGIAKADPSDCFNVHIGKAIALRRALGLEVPAEYSNAPAPTEVRIGDVIWYSDKYPRLTVVEHTNFTSCEVGLEFLKIYPFVEYKIIDDSSE